MALLAFHVAPAPDTPLPPVPTLPMVDRDGPLDPFAIASKLFRKGRLPTQHGQTFHLRIVIGERDGQIEAMRLVLTPEVVARVDWR